MRQTTTLNTGWKFTLEEVPSFAYYKGFDDSSWQTVTVPHDWSVEYPFSQGNSSGTGYLRGGRGWYRCRFQLPEDVKGKFVQINFGGVYKNAKVWVNSNYMGRRPYGYSSFSYDVSDFVRPGENVIAVNCEHMDLADSRWFTGNGIYRDVTVTVTDPLHVEDVFIYTKSVGSAATQGIDWKLSGEGRVRFTVLDAKGAAVAKTEAKGTAGSISFSFSFPRLWSCDSPYLYTLVTEVTEGEAILDRIETKFGIRTFRFHKDTGFTLNGEAMKLKGLCMHHDAGVLGAAVPKEVWRSRFETFKEGGCNAIRCSHNPPDPKFLDLCDEMGFLVMDEAFDEWEGCKNKWWQGHNVYPPKHYGYYEDFPEWHERDLTDLIIRDRNHPSIIMWSIGNEIDYPNDPYVHPYFETMTGNNDANKPAEERVYDPDRPNADRLAVISQELVNIAKSVDGTRPITSALAFPELSNLTGYAQTLDVVGYNYKERLYEEDHAKYASHIIYGSENSTDASKWLDVKNNPYICGQFLWTGIDFLGEAHGWPIRVSGAGLLNLAGYEKPNFCRRKMLWNNTPDARIATGTGDSVYSERFSWNYQEGETVTVSCYTNCANAELFLNGKSLGKQELREEDLCRVTWTVPFKAGELKVQCGNDTAVLAENCLLTCLGASKIELSCKRQDEDAVAQVDLRILDQNGTTVVNDDMFVTCCLKGMGKILGIENGNGADLTPYNSLTRSTFQGRAKIYVRAPRGTVLQVQSGSMSAEITV